MADRKKSICLLSGFSEETDRAQIRREFGKFGTITKIYLSDDFAKIYYEDLESCRNAIRGLSDNQFGWTVEHTEEKPYHKSVGKIDNSFGDYSHSKSNSSNFGASSKKPEQKMSAYDYLDEEFSENMDYCDVHGNPLVLFQADSGEKYVNVEDVRKAGFALFRRDSFNPLLVDRKQIQKEFELHLLSESKNYILKNKAVVIDEEQILRTIERCKNKLLGEQSSDRNQSHNQTSLDNTFAKPERGVQQRGGFNSFETSSPIVPQRIPKALPSNFVPTTTQRNSKPWVGDQQRQQRPRQNSNRETRETNGFGNDAFENKGSFSHRSRQNDGFGFDSNRARSKSRHRDDMSQVSDNSDKKRKYADIENIDKIDKVELDIGSVYDVTISHVERENICWAHKKESSAELENMLIKLFDLAPELEDLSNPTKGQLVLATFEEVWCRARIYNDGPPIYVHFLDYGNRHNTESVKLFPEEFRKIPVLGLRLILNNIQAPLAVDEEIRIRVNRKYTDGTYIADIENMTNTRHEEKKEIREPVKTENIVSEMKFVERERPKPVEVKPKEVEMPKPVDVRPNEVEKPAEVIKRELSPHKEPKTYFDVPKQLADLKNGDKVMLIDLIDNKFAAKTKESVQKSKEVTEYIKNLDKSTLLLSTVEEGQLILCSKDGLPNLYRAVVTNKTSAVAVTVRYLDYPGEDQLAIKSLRNVDDFLASQPTLLLLSPEYKLLKNLGAKSTEFVFHLLENKAKVNVVITDDNDFDLQLDDGSLLSQKIKELNKNEIESKVPKLVPVSSPAKEPETVKSSPQKNDKPSPQKNDKPEPKVVPAVKTDPITYDDMDWIKLEVGSTDSYLCYTIKDLQDLTLISLQDDSINYMARVTDLTVEDPVPYEPSEFEMCLVAYQAPEDDEPQWYRGVVIEVFENGDYTIQAVDFGNQVVVKSKDIRRFDAELKDIPILGISCECVGIPNNAAVLKKLKELIPEGEEVKVIVKEFNELKYLIELPEVYTLLGEAGVC